MKIFLYKLLSVFLIVAFLSLTIACERTVTRYDSQGKPYDTKEFSAWETVGAIILFSLILGAIAASANKNKNGDDGTFLYEGNTLYASVKSSNVMSDALTGTNKHTKWIQLVDANDNLISRHLIQLDELQTGEAIINLSEVELSSEVNNHVLENLIHDMLEVNDLSSVPSAIKADVSFVSDKTDILKVDAVNFSSEADLNNEGSVFILDSGHGFYRIITRLSDNTKSQTNELKQVSVIVSQLN